MNLTKTLATVAGTALLGAAALLPTAASASGNVGWSVSVGVPGLAVTAGAPAYGPAWYGAPYRPYYRPVVVAPAPVYAPWYGPVNYYPAPVVYAPRYVAPRVRYVARPYGAHGYRY